MIVAAEYSHTTASTASALSDGSGDVEHVVTLEYLMLSLTDR